MEEKEIEVNGERIKVAIKLPKEVVEDNNIKMFLDDTIELTKVVEEVKEENDND